MIKVAHLVSSLNVNSGVMTVIMNYYRNIDRSKIRFDFIYFAEMDANVSYKEEIERLG